MSLLPVPLDWTAFLNGDVDPPEPLVGDMLYRGEHANICSAAKVGKSLLLQYISACLASRRAIFGTRHPTPLRVVYIDQENGDDDLRERLTEMGCTDTDLQTLHYFTRTPSWPPFDHPDVSAALKEVGALEADLLVIDTMSKLIAGKENDAETFRAFHKYTLLPLKAANVAAILLDHVGKDPSLGARGSSAKSSDVDVLWRLERPEPDRLVLRLQDSRRRRIVDRIDLQIRQEPRLDIVLSQVSGEVRRRDDAVTATVDQLRDLGATTDTSTRAAMELLAQSGNGCRRVVVVAAMRVLKAAA